MTKLSRRSAGFAAGRAATKLFPQLKSRMPFFDDVAPMMDVGAVQIVEETQTLPLGESDRAFALRLPANERPPQDLSRSIALIALNDVTVLGNTGVVVDEKRERLLVARDRPQHVIYHDFRPEPTRRINKPPANYFTMLGPHRGHAHFFHFLIDRLPKLYYLLERFALGREPLVVLTNDGLPAFQRELYGFVAARYPNLRFEAIPHGERWHVPRLYYLDDFQPIKRTLAAPAMLDFLRALVFEGYGLVPARTNRRLYVSRSDTPKRRLANEALLKPLLAAKGFEIMAPGKLRFRDQAALFFEAEAIVGPHGAGLTNILFAPREARIAEIFPADRIKNTYFLLARSLGQNYRGVIGSAGGRKEWFRVDPDDLERALIELDL